MAGGLENTRAGAEFAAQLRAGEHIPRQVIPTGMPDVDAMLTGHPDNPGGLRTGEVSVIGASTGHGKSTLAEQWALNISRREHVALFALEMGRERTELRMLTKILGLDLSSVEALAKHKPERIASTLESMSLDRVLHIEERDDSKSYTSVDFFQRIKETRPRVAILDHPRHLDDWHGNGRERADLSAGAICRRLVGCAKYYDMHIIVVQQTQRQLFGKRPAVQDLGDTYVLGQVCANAFMVHRPFRGKRAKDTIAEIIIDKNRSGPEGIVHLGWHGSHMKYTGLLPSEQMAVACCASKKTTRKTSAAQDAPPMTNLPYRDGPDDDDESLETGSLFPS